MKEIIRAYYCQWERQTVTLTDFRHIEQNTQEKTGKMVPRCAWQWAIFSGTKTKKKTRDNRKTEGKKWQV